VGSIPTAGKRTAITALGEVKAGETAEGGPDDEAAEDRPEEEAAF